MKIKPEYRGDFMDIDCPKCFRRTTACVKDEELEIYFCCYCGEKMENQKRMWD